MIEFFNQYKFLVVPFLLWFGIQTFKVLYEYFKEGKWNIKRFMGAGGMPSSHSAVVVSLAALVGKYIGISSPIFALSALFAFITMYDAAGVRRAVGKHKQNGLWACRPGWYDNGAGREHRNVPYAYCGNARCGKYLLPCRKA